MARCGGKAGHIQDPLFSAWGWERAKEAGVGPAPQRGGPEGGGGGLWQERLPGGGQAAPGHPRP